MRSGQVTADALSRIFYAHDAHVVETYCEPLFHPTYLSTTLCIYDVAEFVPHWEIVAILQCHRFVIFFPPNIDGWKVRHYPSNHCMYLLFLQRALRNMQRCWEFTTQLWRKDVISIHNFPWWKIRKDQLNSLCFLISRKICS